MPGPGGLLALGGLLAWARGGAGGGTAAPPDFEVEAGVLLAEEPLDPKCFSRLLRDLTCFWDSDAPPDPRPFRLQYRLEQEPWQNCSLAAIPLPRNRSRFWCSLPPTATVAFLPLELRVLPPPPAPPLHHRTLQIEQVVLLGPPQNVSAEPGGARGQLCVRWAPPPSSHLESSLVFELMLRAPGLPPRTVGVGAGRREQLVGALRGSTRYSVRARTRPDSLSYGGYWSPWSPPATAVTPPDMDPVILGLSCLLALLLLGLGLLALLGHRRALREKLWPAVPGPEREFEGLFSAYGGNFQLWLCQGGGGSLGPPRGGRCRGAAQRRGGGSGPPPQPRVPLPRCPPPTPPPPARPPPPASSTHCSTPRQPCCAPPPRRPPDSPYANLAPPERAPPRTLTPPNGSLRTRPSLGMGTPLGWAPPFCPPRMCSAHKGGGGRDTPTVGTRQGGSPGHPGRGDASL
ncbi:hypothetical protein Q9966_016735 [Columba livia]|nr:hypothetical protein Q9966_016735 [Columba livia]